MVGGGNERRPAADFHRVILALQERMQTRHRTVSDDRVARTVLRPFKPLLRAALRRMPHGAVRMLPAHVINSHSYLFGLFSPRIPSFRSKLVLERTDDWNAMHLEAEDPETHGGETLDVFARLLPHVGTVFDIGSHTGIYAIMAGVQDPSRSVYAFEPVPRIYHRLRRNISLNRASNVQAFPYAVSEREGDIRLFVPKGQFPTEASTLPGFREPAETITVSGVTVDSFAAEHGCSPDAMKIDTEGTEDKVLRGARRCLERDRPIIICEVLRGLTEPALHTLLDPLGYSYFIITRDGLIAKPRIEGDPTYTHLNYLMVPRDRAGQVLDALHLV